MKTVLSAGTGAYLAGTIHPNFAYSEESGLFVPKSSIPSRTIYYGNSKENYQNINFVSKKDVALATKEYEEYKKVNAQEDQAKARNLKAKVSEESIDQIIEFARNNNLEILLERDYYEQNGSPFKQVPKQYEDMDFQGLIDELDITYQIIQEYSE